jgi:HEAT repeat protein
MLSVLAGFAISCGSDGDRRLREVDSLRERRDAASVERLEQLAGDPSGEVRAFALSVLAEVTRDRAADRILSALEDEEVTVRATATKLAGDLAVRRSAGTLARLLVADRSIEVRRRAAASLGAVGGEGAAAALAPGLGDADPGVREACARSLARLQDPSPAAAALVRTLQLDPEPRVRLEAVRALKKVDAEEARAGVAAAAGDPNEFVRMEAIGEGR